MPEEEVEELKREIVDEGKDLSEAIQSREDVLNKAVYQDSTENEEFLYTGLIGELCQELSELYEVRSDHMEERGVDEYADHFGEAAEAYGIFAENVEKCLEVAEPFYEGLEEEAKGEEIGTI